MHLSSPVEAFPAILAARWGGARHVVTTEHAPTWRPLQRFYSRAVKRAGMRLLDAVIVLSAADAVFLQETFGAPASLLRVIHNGVPGFPAQIPKIEARGRLGIPPGATVVGYLGALEEKKGLLDLFDAAERSGRPGLTLLLGGEGSFEPALRDRAAAWVFPVVFPGRIEDVGAFLAAIDSGLAWAEGSLWVGQYRDRKIHQVDPGTGAILRTIESNRFVTGVTWVDGELWHGTWEGDESELRHIDPESGAVIERLEMPR